MIHPAGWPRANPPRERRRSIKLRPALLTPDQCEDRPRIPERRAGRILIGEWLFREAMLRETLPSGETSSLRSFESPAFARSFGCTLNLLIEPEEVKLFLVCNAIELDGKGTSAEPKPFTYHILSVPRDIFASEEQIKQWALSVYGTYSRALTDVLVAQLRLHLRTVAKARLSAEGIQRCNNKQMLKEHLGQDREILQQLLGVCGPHGRSPLRSETLTIFIRDVLRFIPKQELNRNLQHWDTMPPSVFQQPVIHLLPHQLPARSKSPRVCTATGHYV
jgi:hypothetical protein